MEWFLVEEEGSTATVSGLGEVSVPTSYAASGGGGEGT